MTEAELKARFVDDDELVGKTIVAVHAGDMLSSRVYLVFSDRTWTGITFGGGYYPGEGEMMFDDKVYPKDESGRWLIAHLQP